ETNCDKRVVKKMESVRKKALMVGTFAMLLVMAAHAQNCNTAVRAIAPCIGFLQTNGLGQPSAQCCSGVKRLAGSATSSPARRQICNCLKTQINRFPRVTNTAVSNLPTKCKAGLGFRISKNINCNT
ncbi:hypothetical protein KI387_024914, partial [Taxus chinensis]